MQREALEGTWLVGDWGLRRVARVELSDGAARVDWPGTSRPEATVAVSGWTRVDGPVSRLEADVDDGRGQARAWVSMLPGGEVVGSLCAGGPLLRARPLELAPEALLGGWEVAPLGERASRRALGWHVAGDTVEIRGLAKVVPYTGLWVADDRGARVVLVDRKGHAVEVRLWPIGDAWLVCEGDTSATYLLHREGAAPPEAWTLPEPVAPAASAPPPDEEPP